MPEPVQGGGDTKSPVPNGSIFLQKARKNKKANESESDSDSSDSDSDSD